MGILTTFMNLFWSFVKVKCITILPNYHNVFVYLYIYYLITTIPKIYLRIKRSKMLSAAIGIIWPYG